MLVLVLVLVLVLPGCVACVEGGGVVGGGRIRGSREALGGHSFNRGGGSVDTRGVYPRGSRFALICTL